MSRIEFETLGRVWEPVKEQVVSDAGAVGYFKHFQLNLQVKIVYMPKAPSPYLVTAKKGKWMGVDLMKLLNEIEEEVSHA